MSVMMGVITLAVLLWAAGSAGASPPKGPPAQGAAGATIGGRVVAPPPTPLPPLIRLAAFTFDPLKVATKPPLATALSLDDYAPDQPGYYILQFQGPIQPEWKKAVIQEGARLYSYIPDFAFIAGLDATARRRVEAFPFVRWLGVYQPAYRLAPDLLATMGQGADPASAAPPSGELEAHPMPTEKGILELTVLIFPDEDVQAAAEALRALGGTVQDVARTKWKGTIRVDLPAERLIEVARLPGVKWIEAAPKWELYNNVAADIMSVRGVWDTHGLRGAGQVVAVADTGLDRGSRHPLLLHNDFEDGRGRSRVVALFDLVGDGASDENSGHGTHVAGSVLGNGLRSGSNPIIHNYPDTAYVGMAPEAQLVFQATEENNTGDLCTPPDLNDLFWRAYVIGARVHSNSWGHAVDGAYDSTSRNVDEFVWEHSDMVILFSAGNNGEDSDADGKVDGTSLGAPGTAKNCITVGATESLRPPGSTPPPGANQTWGARSPARFPMDPLASDHVSDNPGGMAAFSSRGPTLDERTKPDLVAPGTNIISTRSYTASGTLWGVVNGDYLWSGGTSMSTPLVAGTAALVREYYSRTHRVEPSAALVKATLANGARDLAPGQYSPWRLPYWYLETVDSEGDVGVVTSLALDGSGYPHISYCDDTNHDLKYAYQDASGWHIQTVDSEADVRLYTSLGLDGSGYPHISYHESHFKYDLKYAYQDASGWHTETVDSEGYVGHYSSLALDGDGHPHISYLDSTNGNLKYAYWDGSDWDTRTVDSEGSVGAATSLALDRDGHPHISYYCAGPYYELRYAYWNGSDWYTKTVDTELNPDASFTSLALDGGGDPHISYYDATNGNLKYANRDASAWYTETVDSEGTVGYGTSLALDGDGYPHISYCAESDPYFDLKYAYWDGSAWHIYTVDNEGYVGWHTSLALDGDGDPHISYHDGTNEDLSYVYWPVLVEVAPRPNSVEGWGRVDLARSLFPPLR